MEQPGTGRQRPVGPGRTTAHALEPPPPALFEALIADGVEPQALLEAHARAHAAGVPFSAALMAGGHMNEEELVMRLCAWLGCPRADAARDVAAPGQSAVEAARAGLLRLADGRIAAVPAEPLVDRLLREPLAAGRVALATRQTLVDLAVAADSRALAAGARTSFGGLHRHFSARGGSVAWQSVAALCIAFAIGVLLNDEVGPLQSALVLVAALAFIALGVARIGACLLQPLPQARTARLGDDALPVYTILVPLYREVAALPGLIAALAELDYPPEKRDIILLVEADDARTHAALRKLALPHGARIVRVPQGTPRTKPRACNIGLLFARGEYLVVYDAEDRPDPAQLHDALATFARSGREVAVVQAALTIDEGQAGLIPALFRLEYAAHFAVLLPALARLGLPVPLGGTSNHFVTDVLRSVGGWDPFNVTEDADLGVRLYRLGYQARTIASRTLEEAPVTPRAWLRQRTRWLKGWMVTAQVHLRDPARLLADLGPAGLAGFLVVTGGIIVSTLAEILTLLLVGLTLWHLADRPPAPSDFELGLAVLSFVSLSLGHGAALLCGLVGQARMGLAFRPIALLALPLYWLAISFAAWRALWQVLKDPHGWEKTEHLLCRMPDPVVRSKGPRQPVQRK